MRSSHLKVAFLQPTAHQTTSYGDRYWTPLFEALKDTGIHVNLLRAPGRRVFKGTAASLLWTPPSLIQRIAAAEPDIVLCVEYGVTSIWGLIAARLVRGKAVLLQEHARRVEDPLPPLQILARSFLASGFDAVIANTAAARDEVVRRLRIPPKKVYLVPLLVSRPGESSPGSAGSKLHHATLGFLFVGELIARKNVQCLLRAASILQTEDLPFRLEIVGDGPLRAGLEKWCREHGLATHVRFRGFMPYESMADVYRVHDVFIMPSWWDYRSVAVQEAMHFGLPVIDSVRDGNAGDLVRDGFNGFVFDPGDPAQLAGRMRELISEREHLSRLGRNAATTIRDLTPEHAAEELRRTLLEIVR